MLLRPKGTTPPPAPTRSSRILSKSVLLVVVQIPFVRVKDEEENGEGEEQEKEHGDVDEERAPAFGFLVLLAFTCSV